MVTHHRKELLMCATPQMHPQASSVWKKPGTNHHTARFHSRTCGEGEPREGQWLQPKRGMSAQASSSDPQGHRGIGLGMTMLGPNFVGVYPTVHL